MKITDFRIGNFVYEKGEITKIYSLDTSGISCCNINYFTINKESGLEYFSQKEVFTPIPITEEILLKCKGSEEKYKGMFGSFVSIDMCRLNFSFGKECIMTVKKDQCGVIFSFKNMQLHEFQNLIFSLTGEELEIKL